MLKPLLLSLVASFNSALASLVPPQITHKNGSHYLTKLECDKGQAMLQSAVRDSAIQLKYDGFMWCQHCLFVFNVIRYASIARAYVEQVHGTFCWPASIITIVNAARPGVERLLVKDFFHSRNRGHFTTRCHRLQWRNVGMSTDADECSWTCRLLYHFGIELCVGITSSCC